MPGMKFHALGEVVSSLKEEGYIVSIDTFDLQEIVEADEAGIDYVLSLHSANMQVASEIESIPVVISDPDKSIESLHSNISFLEEMGKEYIIDPILSPFNFGFIESLERYIETRRRYPNTEMLAGLGNVIELCDADSVGMNLLLCGMMEELSIQNLLTTEASHKTRGAVRELDIARRMTYYAKKNSMLLRRFASDLLVVKEERVSSYTEEELKEIAKSLHPRDEDFRIFVADKIYVFNGALFVSGNEKGEIFNKLAIKDVGHAFYMGKELERAELALKLGKKYIQEQPLRWGYLGEGGE
jgi:dihydropteroate synthase-like protein